MLGPGKRRMSGSFSKNLYSLMVFRKFWGEGSKMPDFLPNWLLVR